MKLTILLIAVSLQVSATAFSQQISLDYKNAPLQQVMQSILKQTGYGFIIDAINLKLAKPVTITLKEATIEETLQAIFASQPFSYRVEGKSIIILVKGEEKKTSIILQLIDLNGKVTDENDISLPGASVKAGSKVTITNNKGEFSLKGVDENTIVEISYVGYTTKAVKAGNKQFMVVQLERKAGQLEEFVVNKGYYTTAKELNTGSVGRLSAVDIAKQPVSDPLMALEGRISGLYLAQSSGVPGAALKVNLRGLNSIANGTDPLYVIDGIPFNSKSLAQLDNASGTAAVGNNVTSPFASLRPSDIESIDVLKDADATAIYGSRGANGVILITTKKGKIGKTRVDMNVYHGTGQVASKLQLLNTQQYLDLRKEAYTIDNRSPYAATHYDINGKWDQSRYTDWQKLMIGRSGEATNVNASLSGGNENTQFLLSLGYRNENTVFPGDFSNQIGSGNFNINHTSENKKLRVNLSVNYSNNNYQLPTADFTQYIFMAPDAPAVYDSKGQLNWENNTFQNPFSNLLKKSTSTTDNLINNLSLEYSIIKGLQIKSNFGYSLTELNERNITPYTFFMPNAGDDPYSARSSSVGNNSNKAWIIEPQLNYSLSFKGHRIDALLGTTFNESKQRGLLEDANGFLSDALLENSRAATTIISQSSFSQYRYNAIYFRLGYNYMERYVLNLTGRRDGSSRFGPGRQFGNFGSIGVAWIFSKEKVVVEKLSFLSFGKLRGSIGRTGNDQLSNYQYLSTYGPSPAYFGVSGLNAEKLTNPSFRWETINKVEAALELGFLNNKLLLNTNYYRNRTSNQLVGYSLPATTGFSTVTANLPGVIENKGLELELNSINIDNSSLTWKSSFNLTIPKNKLVSYPNIEASSYNYIYSVGQPLNVAFLYHYTGLDKTSGIYTFADFDHDPGLNYGTDMQPVFIGQKYFGGLNNTFNYKGLSLDIFIQYVKQTGYRFFSSVVPGRYAIGGAANQSIDVLDHWKKAGDIATYQRLTTRSEDVTNANNHFSQSDGIVTDASFIRLKNVMLSWTLPHKLIKSIKLENARIYIQGQNIFTITKYKGIDPELARSSNYSLPPLRIITAGVQLIF